MGKSKETEFNKVIREHTPCTAPPPYLTQPRRNPFAFQAPEHPENYPTVPGKFSDVKDQGFVRDDAVKMYKGTDTKEDTQEISNPVAPGRTFFLSELHRLYQGH